MSRIRETTEIRQSKVSIPKGVNFSLTHRHRFVFSRSLPHCFDPLCTNFSFSNSLAIRAIFARNDAPESERSAACDSGSDQGRGRKSLKTRSRFPNRRKSDDRHRYDLNRLLRSMLRSRQILSSLTYCLFLSAPLQSVEPQNVLITPEDIYPELVQIYEAANGQAPSLQLQAERIRESEGSALVYSAEKYPNLRLALNGGYAVRDRADFDRTETFAGIFSVSFEKPIFRWGAIAANDQLGKLSVSRSKVEYEQFYLSLVEQIRSIFLDLVLHRNSLGNQTLKERIFRMRLEDQRKRKEIGTLSEDDYRRTKIGLEEALLAIERTRTGIERALRHFNLITGSDDWEIQQFPTVVPSVSYSHTRVSELLEAYLESGLADGSNWIIKVNEIERAKHDLTIDRARNRPSFDVFVRASQEDRDTAARNDVLTLVYFGGLQVRWDLFQGFANKGRRIAREAQIRILESQLKSMGERFRNEAERQAFDLDMDFKALALNEERFTLDQKQYEKAVADRANGLISEIDFLQKQLNLKNREYSIFQARTRFLKKLSQFLAYIGRDPASDYLTLPKES